MPMSTPHLASIPFTVNEGKEIVVEGTIGFDAKRVTFSLCKESDLKHDTPLTFDIRFNDSVVVRNHFRGSWGPEDRQGGFPFRRGENCEVKIVGRHDAYQIFVNKQHFCDFKHRIEKEAARNLLIEGDFTINKISFPGSDSYQPYNPYQQGGGYPAAPSYQQGGANPAAPSYPGSGAYPPAPSYPSGQGYPATFDSGPFVNPSAQNPNMYPGGGAYPQSTPYGQGGAYPAPPSNPSGPNYSSGFGGGPINNPPVPFTAPIPGGLQAGKIIFISGKPKNNPTRFTLNLATGGSDSGDCGLHFDIRFNYGTDRNATIRTHKQNGSYGPEERQQTNFPFSPGANFEIMILTEHSGFKIAVNNQHYTEFHHRIQPFQKIDHIFITGDVDLTQVRFQ